MKKNIFFRSFIAVFFCFSLGFLGKAQTCNVADSLELVAFYNSTNGASWTSPWILSQKVSTWQGVILYCIRFYPLVVTIDNV